MSAQAIREDRILDEAHTTRGDVRRLCDLFGLSVSGAERYTATVDHPALAGLTGPERADSPRLRVAAGQQARWAYDHHQAARAAVGTGQRRLPATVRRADHLPVG